MIVAQKSLVVVVVVFTSSWIEDSLISDTVRIKVDNVFSGPESDTLGNRQTFFIIQRQI